MQDFALASLTTAERNSRSRAMEYSAKDLTVCIDICEEEAEVDHFLSRISRLTDVVHIPLQIRVRSLQDPGVYYAIAYTIKGDEMEPVSCTCPSYQQTDDRCKHMFLVQRYTSEQVATQSVVRNESDTAPSDSDVDTDEDAASSEEELDHSSTVVPTGDDENVPDSLAPADGMMEMEDVLYQCPDGMPSTDRIRSESPPPLHAAQRDQRHFLQGQAIQDNWNDLFSTLHSLSMSSKLAINHDQERMRNMVAQLQSMISTWPEVIGQRAPNASQRL